MAAINIRGRAAVVGVGESAYYRHGRSPSPEFKLLLDAVLAAAEDAGIDAKSIDGFVSYANDRNSSVRLANALGVREYRWSGMQWGGGGAGHNAAIQQAAAVIACGFAETVVVYRGLTQGQHRIGSGAAANAYSALGTSLRAPYGVNLPAELFASRMTRYMYEHDISPSTQRAVSLAAYHHAKRNPRAVMHEHELTAQKYDESRWIVEPWRLYDCCQETDGAAAVVLTSAEIARDTVEHPVYVLGAASGGGHRSGGLLEGVYDGPKWATAEFDMLAVRAFEMAGVTPADVDVVQAYENFTGGVVMALIEHGLCAVEEANAFLTFENLTAPTGRLPLNTSGGNLAEAYVHGLELNVEAVRQLRGSSFNQVPDARVALVTGGPMVTPASTIIFGSEATLA